MTAVTVVICQRLNLPNVVGADVSNQMAVFANNGIRYFNSIAPVLLHRSGKQSSFICQRF
jgi:hypothetical protein